jgi:hypothetical protein
MLMSLLLNISAVAHQVQSLLPANADIYLPVEGSFSVA